jgi:hypothetical protein
MTTEPMTEPTGDTAEVEPVQPMEQAPEQTDDDANGNDETVRALRDELAKRRIKAREQVSEANQRLALAYVRADARLVDSDAFTVTDELLGDDGFIDAEKVTGAIDALLAAKPYLSARKPSAPITQGVQPLTPEASGLFTLIRDRY